VNLAVFLLAFFLDFFELAFIIVPLVKPAAEAIFKHAPESVAIAKSFGMSVASGVAGGPETVVDVGPFMIWFGVLLAVNMQTSFMHPPFGFALMFLRSVAPDKPYPDKVTGRMTPGVSSAEIYWGAVPFVVIQLAMVALLILMPSLTMGAKTIAVPTNREMPPVATTGSQDRQARGLTLPGIPPRLDGSRAYPTEAKPGPSLDFSVPPQVR
jgi:TRAP-type C4-dicarboxylate transport system permease large subunit